MTKLKARGLFGVLLAITVLLMASNSYHVVHSNAAHPGMASLLMAQSYLPRVCVALLAGAALGLCG